MKRLIALAALAAVALVPATAEAKGSKVLRGDFTLVGADGDYVTGKFGKAQLVDGKRNDKLSVHVRRLAKRATYTYKLQTGSCGGAEVTGWKYKKLKTSGGRTGNSTARSKTFKIVSGTKYFVSVYSADNQLVVCARLTSKGKATPTTKDKTTPRGKSDDKPKADDKPRGKSDDAPGQAEDKTRGKSDDAPGRAEDKQRGKSEDAPGQNKDKSKKKPRRR
jgi:hypothetical protein